MKAIVTKTQAVFNPIKINVELTFESIREVQDFLDDANGRFDAESDEIVELVQQIAVKLEEEE